MSHMMVLFEEEKVNLVYTTGVCNP